MSNIEFFAVITMTASPQTNSDLVRLERANRSQLFDTLKALLDRGEALDQTARIIEKRIEDGACVLIELLAELIGRTKSRSLYTRSQSQLSKDDRALLALYKHQYPDPEIESSLCKRLYNLASNDAEPRRRCIVEAMRETGSPAVLPTLEAILFDHAPTLKAKQVIAQAVESAGITSLDALLATIENSSRRQFIKAVTAAISAVKERSAPEERHAPKRPEVVSSEYDDLRDEDQLRAVDVIPQELSRGGDGEKMTLETVTVRECFFPVQSQHDAFVEIRNLLQTATTSITVVDPYVDQTVLTRLAVALRPGMIFRILTAKLPPDFVLEGKTWKLQYSNATLEIRTSKEIDDRFVVLDDSSCWPIGSSIKDAGGKAFMIKQVEDANNRAALLVQVASSWQAGNPVL